MSVKNIYRLSFLQKFSYGSGNFAANLMNCTVGTYISFYYTDVAGLPIAAVGIILLLCRVLDGISDLCMGWIVERTHTKYGKARPWLFRMAIPFGIAIFLMFFSPNFGIVGKIIYAGATYIAGIAVIYTAISVPYNTLSVLITKSTDERTQLATMRQLFGFIGPLVITTISIPIINTLGANQLAWSILTGIYGLIGAFIYLWIFFSIKEINTFENNECITFKEKTTFNKIKIQKNIIINLKALIKNKFWLIVIFINMMLFVNWGVQGGVKLYYCIYVLQDANFFSVLAIASQLPNILCCFFIPAIVKKYGKRNVSTVGCIISIIGGLMMLIDPTNLMLLFISTIISTIGLAPISICVFAMLGDTAIYGQWKTKIKNEGMIFSAATFGEKIGYALGGALTAFIMAYGGYIAKATIQTDTAIFSMKFCMIIIPIIISSLIVIALKYYKLDEIYNNILKDLIAQKED